MSYFSCVIVCACKVNAKLPKDSCGTNQGTYHFVFVFVFAFVFDLAFYLCICLSNLSCVIVCACKVNAKLPEGQCWHKPGRIYSSVGIKGALFAITRSLIVGHRIVAHCIVLYRIIAHCIVSHCIIAHMLIGAH